MANWLDLSGDQLDEIVLWDEKRTCTQDRPFNESVSMCPCATPITTSENYRTNVSMPARQQVKAKR